jgi:hypothetical protein
MSMKTYAGCGYLSKASDLEPILPVLHRVEYRELIEKGDTEEIQKFLSENWPVHFPPFIEVYCHFEEDESEDLEHGEIYVIFVQEDLFVTTPTKGFSTMKDAGVEPKFAQWVQWG